MILTHSVADKVFIFNVSYNERDIAKAAGFHWNPTKRRWETRDETRAAQLVRYADDSARERLVVVAAGSLQAIDASRAIEADIAVPGPAGLDYRPFQLAGIAYALARKDTLIGDEMGLGKTVEGIGFVNALRVVHAARVLVICPASLRINWLREWRTWCVVNVVPRIITDAWPRMMAEADLFGDGLCAIMSYEGAVKWRQQIESVQWDVAIFDEAHNLKNGKSLRTKMVLGGGRERRKPIRADRRLFLTGTPIMNRPEELWPMIHSIDPTGLGSNRKSFFDRYVYETRHLHELHNFMRHRFMVRRLKADVLKELPPKRRQVILLEGSGIDRAVAAERDVLARKAAELRELAVENAVGRLAQWRGAAMTEMSRIRHETAIAKTPAAIDHIRGVLEEGGKALVFCHHHDVIDMVAAAFPTAARLDGRQSPEQRDAEVRRFKTSSACRLFIGSIRAAGVGLTLTEATTVLFLELDWVPAAMMQAEDRAHRMGQRDSVLVQHLVADRSIDQAMSAALIKKAEVIEKILDGQSTQRAKVSVIDEVLRGR